MSGFDAILPCPVEGPRAARTTAGGDLRNTGRATGGILLIDFETRLWQQPKK
ncbi:hypothetical protein ACMT4L_17620 [Deinococcus sp. A31D244]|uniref:hypothetical protein n=1 Tax=Deinococcus sp. A31D244 TaxID=3397675 RepID=UPI0039DFA472